MFLSREKKFMSLLRKKSTGGKSSGGNSLENFSGIFSCMYVYVCVFPEFFFSLLPLLDFYFLTKRKKKNQTHKNLQVRKWKKGCFDVVPTVDFHPPPPPHLPFLFLSSIFPFYFNLFLFFTMSTFFRGFEENKRRA